MRMRACKHCGRTYEPESLDLGICCICFRDMAYARVLGTDWEWMVKQVDPKAVVALFNACRLALSELGEDDEDMPEPTHEGSCGPWADCDGNCQDIAYTADRNVLRRTLHNAIARAKLTGAVASLVK